MIKNDINVHLQGKGPCKRKVEIMSAMINFMQALRELTGFEELEDLEELEDKELVSEPDTAQALGKIKINEPKIEMPQISAEKHGSHITSTMIIHGNIKTSDDVVIDGAVYGNVEADGNVAVKNIIVGDIKAANASFAEARVKGNITVGEKAAVDSEAIIVGNVSAEAISVSGKIKGDLKAGEAVILKEEALVSGNILTGSFVSHPGARIRGSVITGSSADLDEDIEFCLGVEEHEI